MSELNLIEFINICSRAAATVISVFIPQKECSTSNSKIFYTPGIKNQSFLVISHKIGDFTKRRKSDATYFIDEKHELHDGGVCFMADVTIDPRSSKSEECFR